MASLLVLAEILLEHVQREREERFVVLLQRLCAERLEARLEPRLRLLEQGDLLGGRPPLELELRAQTGRLGARAGARDQPRRGGAGRDSEPDEERGHRTAERYRRRRLEAAA